MTENNNVVFLKTYSNEQLPDTITFLCCKHCRNKTYTHTYEQGSEYPLVKCSACGSHIGRIGWVE